MNDYFDKQGHITKAGFNALLQKEANGPQLLRLSEHLSVCDQCLLTYTEHLTPDPLMTPDHPLTGQILRKLRLRLTALTANRYVTAGIAACIAMVLWVGGMFTPDISLENPSYTEDLRSVSAQVSEKTRLFTSAISDAISQIVTIGGNSHEKK